MLIADDEPDIRALITHVLTAEGLEVIAEAGTAPETLAAWREHRPDVIVLDQRLPPGSGLDVAAEILHEVPGQVIFLFSAFVDAELRSAARDVGIADCIAKDRVFDIPALVRAHGTRRT